MKIKYFLDEEKDTYYERFLGKNVHIKDYVEALLNPQHKETVSRYKNIICDMRNISPYKEDFHEYQELYSKHFQALKNLDSNFHTFVICISNINEMFFFRPFKEHFREIKNVRVKMFLEPKEIAEYMGFDTLKYFNIKDEDLKEF